MNHSEREQLDQRVSVSPDLLASIIGSTMDAIIAVDHAQRIVLFNAAAERIFACAANEAIGSSVERFIPERFRAGHSTRVRQFDKSGAINRTMGSLGTLWGLRATGEEFPIEASISKVESGGKKFFTAVIRDISDRQRAEKALRESEEKFLKAFRGNPVAVALSSVKDGRLIEVNKTFERILGYPHEELIGSRVSDIGIWVDPSQREELTRRLLSERTVRDLELRFRTKNGGILTCLVSAELIEVGNEPCILSVTSDITERKLADEALRTSEERFRLAALAGKMFAYEWDAVADVITRSGDFAQILGSDEPVETTGQQLLGRIHPDDREKVVTAVAALTPEAPHLQISYRMTRHDGTFIWVERNSNAHFDEQRRMRRLVGMVTDITERKRAEEALRASEERLRLAQSAARIGTFEWNIRTGISVWTPELQAIFGLPPGGHDGTHANFEELVHPDDRARMIELTDWAMKTGKPTDGEFRIVWPDGSLHWINGRAQVILDDSGQPSRMVGVNVDVTERKLAEQALARASERLLLAIEAGSVGGWDYDLRTGKNVWFGGAHAQLGITPDETSGSHKEFWDRVHKGDRERVEQALLVAKEKHEDFTEDFRVVWRDGTTHWLRSRGRYYYAADGEPLRMLGMSLDITERRRAEETLFEMNRMLEAQSSLLRSREELLKVFVKNVPAAVAMFDREMRYLEVSDRWCTTYSVDSSQLLGRSHYDAFPELPERYKEIHRRGLAGETIRADEDRWEREGSTAWARWEVRPWKTPEGTVGGILVFVEDITRRKQMEEELSTMSRKLIESQEQERARIGRELHDDINQRLAMLSLELEQLQENSSEIQPRVKELRRKVAEVSNDVQALSHDLHSSKLEYLGVVAGMKSWCKEFAERQKLEIDFRCDVSSVLPLAIGLSLFRVLQEALNNAVKHSGVKWIGAKLRQESGEIHLIVSDLGRGFDVESVKQGKGLGLSSMRERVRLVNGTISIESTPLGGTTIYVRVPLESGYGSERVAV